MHECAECGEEIARGTLCSDCAGEVDGDEFDADELGLDPEQPYDYPEE